MNCPHFVSLLAIGLSGVVRLNRMSGFVTLNSTVLGTVALKPATCKVPFRGLRTRGSLCSKPGGSCALTELVLRFLLVKVHVPLAQHAGEVSEQPSSLQSQE